VTKVKPQSNINRWTDEVLPLDANTLLRTNCAFLYGVFE